jgi:hypothetical protein
VRAEAPLPPLLFFVAAIPHNSPHDVEHIVRTENHSVPSARITSLVLRAYRIRYRTFVSASIPPIARHEARRAVHYAGMRITSLGLS